MTRLPRPLLAVLAVLPLAACEPIADRGDPSTQTRFGAGDLERAGGVEDGLQTPDEEPRSDPAPAASGDPDPGMEEPFVDPGSEMRLRQGHLQGAIGPVAGLADDATSLSGFESEGWYAVSTTVSDPSRIAMTIFEVMGDIDALERGRTYRYGTDGYSEADPSAPWLNVIGCAAADDPEEGFDFDQPADEVVVTLEEPEPDVVHVGYEARFVLYDDSGYEAGDTLVQGRFVWER